MNNKKGREIWRRAVGDYYSPSIHTTDSGEIAIQVGTFVIIMTIEKWHELGVQYQKSKQSVGN